MKNFYILLFFIVILVAASGFNFSADNSANLLHDGYYTAEMAEYINGWKEYLTIYVNHGKIITAEFDGRNSSGFVKSWDMDYMRNMNQLGGTYPNKFMRAYVSELVARQSTEGIDAVSGATDSYHSFKKLADAAMLQARAGNGKVAFVDIGREEQISLNENENQE